MSHRLLTPEEVVRLGPLERYRYWITHDPLFAVQLVLGIPATVYLLYLLWFH